MTGCIAIIPALNPQKQLLDFVQQLHRIGFQHVVIINDGSDEKYDNIFKGLALHPFCHILKNQQNKGKGYSLKRGFQYVLEKWPTAKGVMTIGAHGQHRLQDIHLIMKMTKVFANSMIIGVRNMKSPEISFNQYVGYRAATLLFHLLYQKHLHDIQSGLRYIPIERLPMFLNVAGDDFDYDMTMLIETIRHGFPIYEIEIDDARLTKNALLHYDEVMSMKEVMLDMLVQFFRKEH